MAELREDKDFPKITEFHSSLNDKSRTINVEELQNEINKIQKPYEESKIEALFGLPESSLEDNGSFWAVNGLAQYTSPVCVADYVESLNLFNLKQAENPNYRMIDYLKWYNHLDTKVLNQALLNFTSKFWEYFEVNPFDYRGLPGMAEAILQKQWDSDKGNLVTMHED